MSKGHRQRPCDKKKFNENWDRIFSYRRSFENIDEETGKEINKQFKEWNNAKQS